MAKPTEKRALASEDQKKSPDQKRTKRRKVAPDATPNKTSVSSDTPSKIGKENKLAKIASSPAVKGSSDNKKKTQKTGGEVSKKSRPASSPAWSLSRSAGGRFNDVDPIFTLDDKHLIITTDNTVQVLSLATSSVVRTLQNPGSNRITACSLSIADPEHVYTAARSGLICKWNWTTGERLEAWKTGRSTFGIDVCSSDAQDTATSTGDIIFSVCEVEKHQREILVNIKVGGQWKTKVILTTATRLDSLKVTVGGRIIVCTAGDQLVVGQVAQSDSGSLNALYTWHEIALPVSVTCFDIRQAVSAQKASAASAKSQVLDLILGEQGGSILVCTDFLNSILRRQSTNDVGTALVSSRLHWHRNRVNSVKWSKDGNYIISGGTESVMVHWQLDTGRKQFLPHLPSHVCSIVVSPAGNAYALRLADNSAIVLSTLELKPTAHVTGLQLHSITDLLTQKPSSQETKPKASKTDPPPSLSALLHPVLPDRLLLAAPSSPANQSLGASFLQTFDVRANQNISRQALARTNVSVLNAGPSGVPLTSPEVKHMQISFDGEWLATVDEWYQYPQDTAVLNPSSIADRSASANSEIFLKFWRWNESSTEWELLTRINAPHFKTPFGSTQVLDVVANPEGLGFATVGSDATVRFWTQGFRYRNEQKMRNSKKQALQTWSCTRTVTLENIAPVESLSAHRARLAFSKDGSVLAACWTGYDQSKAVYLVDSQSGEICHTREGLYSGTIQGVGFLERYLVVLSEQLVVWDTVADSIKFSMLLRDKSQPRPSRTFPTLLALDTKTQTFAVTFPGSTKPKQYHSYVAVFDPANPKPLFQSRLDIPCRALLSDIRSGGFLLIDTGAHYRRISSGTVAPALAASAEVTTSLRTGLNDIFGGRSLLPSSRQDVVAGAESGSREKGSLSDVFDVGPSFAMPAIDVLFQDVVDHFGTTMKA
ncbi:hypothetical protein AJ80_04046 [Polytolypa hystricis UAMH7299]|uniref:Uncharacterized protein n=1 Tax=Polytolypa hystricis (strain UAMH7299) TaxID=1447883 RepID=A0A2B7YE30_POLH7|nr:hypothetical protein AJ80_04046 [Polytolypa hystricis UAMH7299]